MICPKCGSENVTVTTEQISAKTRAKGKGCLWTLGRWMLICCTAGLWLLIGKRKGKSTTQFKNTTVAICQNCGNKWEIL